MRTPLRNHLGRLCSRLADILEDWSRKLTICEQCGESLYYGKPCPEYRQ